MICQQKIRFSAAKRDCLPFTNRKKDILSNGCDGDSRLGQNLAKKRKRERKNVDLAKDGSKPLPKEGLHPIGEAYALLLP